MLKTLVNLGFKQQEAEVYLFLVLNGPKRAKYIADALETYKRKVYRALKNLQNLKIASATQTLPAEFYAISFEKVLDLFMKAAMEQAKTLQVSKKKLLSTWRSMNEKDSSNS